MDNRPPSDLAVEEDQNWRFAQSGHPALRMKRIPLLTALLAFAIGFLNAEELSAHLKQLRTQQSKSRKAIAKVVSNPNEHAQEMANLERTSFEDAKASQRLHAATKDLELEKLSNTTQKGNTLE